MQNVQNLFTFDNTNSFRRFGVAPVLVWPSLGKPAILSLPLNQLLQNSPVRLEMIVLTEPYKRIDDIRQELATAIRLIPLLGIDGRTGRANQGSPLLFTIEQVQILPFVNLNDPAVLTNYFNHSPRDREMGLGCEPLHQSPLLHEFFCGKNTQLRLEGTITLSSEVSRYLQSHPLILFNIVEQLPGIPERILYHSVCLTSKVDWAHLTFFHASDLHVAKRNDDMLGVITARFSGSSIDKVATAMDQTVDTVKNVVDQTVDSVKKALPGFLQKIKKAIPGLPIKTIPNPNPNPNLNPNSNLNSNLNSNPNMSEPSTPADVEKAEVSELPLEQRAHNPNNMLRRLIRYANAESFANRCDFLLFTGDIIDFCVKSDNPSEQTNFDFDHTNWERFLEIILHLPQPARPGFPSIGIEPSQELLVPIFTILGNHDLRVGHYGLGSLSIFKLFGLRLREAMAYEDPNKTVLQLIPHNNAMMAYYQNINPFEDFYLKLGSNLLLCMNSGVDAIQQPQYMLIGEPSLTGLSDTQMQYMQTLVAQIHPSYPNGQLFVCTHAPILNPVIRNAIQMGVLQKLRRIPNIKLEDFKESHLQQLEEQNTRSDLDLDYHCGVISNNWAQTLAFLDRNKGIALNGHTHFWREFRTKEDNPANSSINSNQPKPETPYAIYWDDYTMIFQNSPETLESLLPLHLQVPALGLPNIDAKLQPGAFRTVEISGNRIKKLNIGFLGK